MSPTYIYEFSDSLLSGIHMAKQPRSPLEILQPASKAMIETVLSVSLFVGIGGAGKICAKQSGNVKSITDLVHGEPAQIASR